MKVFHWQCFSGLITYYSPCCLIYLLNKILHAWNTLVITSIYFQTTFCITFCKLGFTQWHSFVFTSCSCPNTTWLEIMIRQGQLCSIQPTRLERLLIQPIIELEKIKFSYLRPYENKQQDKLTWVLIDDGGNYYSKYELKWVTYIIITLSEKYWFVTFFFFFYKCWLNMRKSWF